MPRFPDQGKPEVDAGATPNRPTAADRGELAPKKQGIVTNCHAIRKRKAQENTRDLLSLARTSAWSLSDSNLDDVYATVKVPQRRIVTRSMDIARLADWLDEQVCFSTQLPE